MNPTVACVLRASPQFRPETVVRLFEGVRANWGPGPLDFLALTDTPINHPGIREIPLRHPWPGYWSKLNLFDPALDVGHLLYFDLDVMVVGSLAEFRANRSLAMLRALRPRRFSRVNSSIMTLPPAARLPVWDAFHKEPARIIKAYKWGSGGRYAWGDQGLLAQTWTEGGWPVALWQDICPGQVESYKGNVRKRGGVGAQTRVVYFHGKPRPWDIGWKLPGRLAQA